MTGFRTRARGRPWVVWLTTAGLLAGLIGAAPANAAVSGRTYSFDADFDEGIMVGVNHDAPNNDQLQLSESSSTFPFIWVANSSEGTISKLDTQTGAELGRYRTAPANIGANPSRTTVDLDGNVWVGNRNSNTVTKVGLLEAGNCIDRNGNSIIETSTGAGDVKAWPAAGDPEDECVLLHVAFPAGQGNNVRMVAVNADNNIYAGGSTSGWFHLIDGQTGAILLSRNHAAGGSNNYGGVVDPEGNLWIATLSNRLVKYDPVADLVTFIPMATTYGLGIDRFGHLWVSHWTSGTVSKVRRSDNAILGTYPIPSGSCSRGVAVEDNGDVWIANTCTNTVGVVHNDGTPNGSVPVGSSPTGVAIDAAGMIWVANLGSNNATRIDPVTRATSTHAVGIGPYNYSDMTGFVVRNITTTQGTWVAIHDGGEAGADWDNLNWNGMAPGGTSISARVRAADSVAGLGAQPWTPTGSGAPLAGVTGRYIQIEMKLETTVNGASPVLNDVTIAPRDCPDTVLTWRGDLAGGSYDLGVNDSMDIIFHWGTCTTFIPNESVIIVIQDVANPNYPVTTWVFGYDITIDMLANQYVQSFTPASYSLMAGTDLKVFIYMDYELVGEADIHIIP